MTAIRTNTPRTRTTTTTGFSAWRRRRPLVGGVLVALSGIEMFFSGQLDLGNIRIQMGFEGFQATVMPALLALLGVLVIITPAQRMFYGIFALILAVYSLVGVNLGGFVLGMLLGAVGGVLTVAWRPKEQAAVDDIPAADLAAAELAAADPAAAVASEPAQLAPEPAERHGHGVVHAEAVDYATLTARIAARKAGGSSATKAPAEPRPFARSRS